MARTKAEAKPTRAPSERIKSLAKKVDQKAKEVAKGAVVKPRGITKPRDGPKTKAPAAKKPPAAKKKAAPAKKAPAAPKPKLTGEALKKATMDYGKHGKSLAPKCKVGKTIAKDSKGRSIALPKKGSKSSVSSVKSKGSKNSTSSVSSAKSKGSSKKASPSKSSPSKTTGARVAEVAKDVAGNVGDGAKRLVDKAGKAIAEATQ